MPSRKPTRKPFHPYLPKWLWTVATVLSPHLLNVGVVIVDEQFRICFANTQFTHDFAPGERKPKLIGQNYFKTIFGFDSRRHRNRKRAELTPLAEAFRTGRKTQWPGQRVVTYHERVFEVAPVVITLADGRRVAIELWTFLGPKTLVEAMQ